jgi:phosphoribosylformylglycinamidine synthase subunit PurSL
MSLNVMDEALRQVVAVGGRRDKTALLDNFCWGNPEVPERLGEFVRAAQACYDGAMAYETPFISGKDSFYNEYAVDGGTISIPPTLLISAMSVMDDVTNCISMDFKAPRHFIYVVGIIISEMGGSYYLKINDRLGSAVPAVNLETAPGMMDRLSRAIEMGLVKSCHDCSEGGVGVALAEMAFAGGYGASVDLGQVEMDEITGRSDIALFAETPTRWICEVAPDDVKRFEIALEGFVSSPIGQTTEADKLRVMGLSGKLVINSSLADLKEAWQGTLREV